jgi:predicted Zn-dependent peptidase
MLKINKAEIVAFAKQLTGNNYVLTYKHTGPDNSIVKVEKPAITPVFINKDAQSDFLKKIAAMPKTPVQPQWVDYDRVIGHGKIGSADLLYVQNKDNTLFTLNYRFKLGSWNNKLLPLAAEYLGFLGTNQQTSAQITRAFYDIACNYKVSIGGDEAAVTISGLQENFEQAVKLFEDLVNNCQPDETALTAYKGRLTRARENNKLNKAAIMKGLLQYAQYGPENPFNYQLSPEALNAVTASELTGLLHGLLKYLHTISYYGPTALSKAENEIQKAHTLPAAFTVIPPAKPFAQAVQTQNQVLFTGYDMVQAEVYWVRNTIPYQPDQTGAIDVFNNYFGGSMASVVFQTIRESRALAYSTYAQYSQPDRKEKRYTATAYVGTQADKMKEAVGGMNELLNNLPENPALLDNARQSILQDIATERIRPEEYTGRYLAGQKLGLSGDPRRQVYDQVGRINFADLKQLHDQNLKDKPYTYCILGSEKKIDEKHLGQYGAVRKLSLAEIFGY